MGNGLSDPMKKMKSQSTKGESVHCFGSFGFFCLTAPIFGEEMSGGTSFYLLSNNVNSLDVWNRFLDHILLNTLLLSFCGILNSAKKLLVTHVWVPYSHTLWNWITLFCYSHYSNLSLFLKVFCGITTSTVKWIQMVTVFIELFDALKSWSTHPW